MVQSAMELFKRWKAAQDVLVTGGVGSSNGLSIKCYKLIKGFMKFNVDAEVFESSHRFDVKMVLRDHIVNLLLL